MTPLTLSHRGTWELLGISRSEFYRLKKRGMFAALESPIAHRYSRQRVEAFARSDRWKLHAERRWHAA